MQTPTLATLANGQQLSSQITAINSNFQIVANSLGNTVDRYGSVPNQMQTNLDMNFGQILNLPPPATVNSPVRLQDVVNLSVALTVPPVGTSGATVPLLNGINTWSALQTFNNGIDLGASTYLNWNTPTGTTGYGLRDNGGKIQYKNFSGVWANIRNMIYVTDYGADNSGATDSTSAIQAAITAAEGINQGIACVYFEAGVYKVSSTIQISNSNVYLVGEQAPNCVVMERFTDYGAVFQFSNASNIINNVGIFNIQIDDIPALTNASGFSTTANSPYQIIFDGCLIVHVNKVKVLAGSGSLALKAVLTAWIIDCDLGNPGTSELNNTGTGLYIGNSTNTNLATQYCSLVYIDNLEIEGGSPFAGKLADGVRVDGCDGVWINNSHIQGTLNADINLSHSGSFPMANFFINGLMCDECAGNGILMNGTKQIINGFFKGSVNCNNGGGANKAGWALSSTGGLSNFYFEGVVFGWGGPGILLNASNTQIVTIRSNVFGNNVTGGNSAISILQGTDISVCGGQALNGAPNIIIGASASRIALTGVLASSSSTFGVTLVNGSSAITISGCDLSNCTSGAISDSSGAVLKEFTGNLGTAELYQSFIFANLPSSPTAGMFAYITDSTTATWGATIAGSSTHKILGWYNGTNWTVVGS